MKKLQSSLIAKVCVWIVLLAAAFGAGIFGMETALDLPDRFSDHWQDTGRFYNAREARRAQLMDGLSLSLQIDALREKITAGETGPMAHADLEALQEEREALEERFSRENTWFRFRIMSSDGTQVLGTNLLDNEAMSKAVRTVNYRTFEVRNGDLVNRDDYFQADDWAENHYLPPEQIPDSETSETMTLVLEYGVPAGVDSSIFDEFAQAQIAWVNRRNSFDPHLTGFLNLSALTMIALIWILWTSGHKSGADGIVTTWQERMFFDLYASVMVTLGVVLVFGAIWVVEQMYDHSSNAFYTEFSAEPPYNTMAAAGIGTICASFAGTAALLLRTFAVRLKAGVLMQSTLLCRVAG